MTKEEIRKEAERISSEVLKNKDQWWLQADEIESLCLKVRNEALEELKSNCKFYPIPCGKCLDCEITRRVIRALKEDKK